jgi:hypothetical protein
MKSTKKFSLVKGGLKKPTSIINFEDEEEEGGKLQLTIKRTLETKQEINEVPYEYDDAVKEEKKREGEKKESRYVKSMKESVEMRKVEMVKRQQNKRKVNQGGEEEKFQFIKTSSPQKEEKNFERMKEEGEKSFRRFINLPKDKVGRIKAIEEAKQRYKKRKEN